ncbi:MAG: endonuclease MutS2, partial [candidate division Zixibacteria bacterium]|nr:endonuclease MutS2 [candidate division Zixibacteria bacterium]
MIITGPNTGGKTVALKSVGLLIVMAQSGLHIPADYKSEIGIFKNIFADIGDEQSIELSLSTFSSHIRQIIFAVKHSGPNCLILLDEIGAGTDPKEGSSLAEAILLKLIQNKAKVIATTHYSQLKTLPMLHPEIENASFEFDRESLRPTYRLQTGIPGASYAVEIASRLGMPQDITDNAAELVGKSERSLTKLIESLENELATLRKDKATLEDRLKKAGQLEDYYKSQSSKLESEIEQTKKEHLDEIQQTLLETRFVAEKVVKDIKENNASKDSVKKAHKFLREKENLLNKFRSKQKSKKKADALIQFETGDKVLVVSLNSDGEIIDLVGNNRARVNLGNMVSTVDLSDLKKIGGNADKTRAVRSASRPTENDTAGPEVHLRGLTVDEAMEKIDKYLDSAVVSGLTQIYVIHGKGTGTLRKVISGYLKKHSAVKSFRLGDWNEGGAGVTVVQLK